MNPQFLRFTTAFAVGTLLLCIAASARAQQVSADAVQPPLKPFLPVSAPTGATSAKALQGVWQGVFKHKNPDGTTSETAYVVEVGPDLRTLKVSLAPSQPMPVIYDTNTDLLLQPTVETQPAAWDGTTLQVQLHDEHPQAGNGKVTVEKRLGLRLERDSRHALFTYEVCVASDSSAGKTTTTKRGSGVLTRPR